MPRAVSSKNKNKKSRKSIMTEKLLEKKVDLLAREVAELRVKVAAANVPWDDEGKYRPEFVKKIKALDRKKDKGTPYTSAKDFLKEIGG